MLVHSIMQVKTQQSYPTPMQVQSSVIGVPEWSIHVGRVVVPSKYKAR